MWCYICGEPFGSELECYDHMRQVHDVNVIGNAPVFRDMLEAERFVADLFNS
jgi:hypothetical protein